MKLFKKKINPLEDRIKKLEEDIFPKSEKDESKEEKRFFPFLSFDFDFHTRLKDRVENLEKYQIRDKKLIKLILKHLGLEYVKITEENGDKKEREILRKVSKKKAKKVSE